MSYLALYRKYRPSRFEDVSGQDTTVRILRNQIVTGRIGHAYLFLRHSRNRKDDRPKYSRELSAVRTSRTEALQACVRHA